MLNATNSPQVDPELTAEEIGAHAYDAGQAPPAEKRARRFYMLRAGDYGRENEQQFAQGHRAWTKGQPLSSLKFHDQKMGWLNAKLEAAGVWG